MNDYLNALYSDVPSAQPNEWSQMLMSMANQNNQWSAEQAQKQMDFQKEMSDTAIQRQVADLKAAGINPILSAKLGGASTPNGASATADSSLVSSMVSLMDKMLDVQGTSAAAAYNASGGYESTYGVDGSGSYGSDGSATAADARREIADSVDAFTKEDFPYLPSNWRDAAASFANGFLGKDNPKTVKSENAHNIGEKAAEISDRYVDTKMNESNAWTQVGKDLWNSAKTVAGKAVNKVKSWFK